MSVGMCEMTGTANLIQEYYHLHRSNQLGSIITQVDRVSDLIAGHLRAEFTVIFYRKADGDRLIPVACHREDDLQVEQMNLLEDDWSLPDRMLIGPCRVDALGSEGPDGQRGARDGFAGRNGFSHRFVCPQMGDGGRVEALIVAYWKQQPRIDPLECQDALQLMMQVVMGAMSTADQMHVVSNFSIRLGELLAMFDLQLGNYGFRDLVTRIMQHSRLAVPVAGVCLMAKNTLTGDFEPVEFVDASSDRPGFADALAGSVGRHFTNEDLTGGGSSLRYAFGDEFASFCEALVMQIVRADKNHTYVLATWTRQAAGFSANDLELLSVFGVFARSLLRNALLVKQLKKSKKVLERSSTRMADIETLAALTDMTSGVAHDFNNVIGGIVGRVQLMKMKVTDEFVLNDLNKVESLAMEGAGTVRRIQEYTTHARDKKLEPLDLCEVIDECTQRRDAAWKRIAADKGVTVDVAVEVDEAMIEGNREDLIISFNELLKNAVEHSQENAAVRLSLGATEKHWVIRVEDSGNGIPEDIQTKIFYPFFTTKTDRGAGLGLAMVHGIVIRHGGSIAFADASGGGTVFTITLERRDDIVDDTDTTRRSRRAEQLNVLVVDDDDQIREVLSDMLTIDGHAATACPDGQSALEAVKRQDFDLVITDLGMPGMSGLELAAQIHDRHPDLPIAMITGWGTQLDPDEVLRHGILTVLSKPFHLKDVKSMVKDLVTS